MTALEHRDPRHELVADRRPYRRAPAAKRFMDFVNVSEGGCWLWTGYIDGAGYGRFAVSASERQLAHRFSYQLFVGPIPGDRELDHVRERGCTSTACVNPSHLEPVTHRENMLRGSGAGGNNARKTRCPRGHEYDSVRPNGWRRCSTCDTATNERRNERRRLARASA